MRGEDEGENVNETYQNLVVLVVVNLATTWRATTHAVHTGEAVKHNVLSVCVEG